MTGADATDAVRGMLDGFSAHDREAVAATLAEDFRFGPFDRDDFLEIEFTYEGAFSDFRYEIDDLFTDGEMVACRWRFLGTHDGDRGLGVLDGFPPTGEKVDISGIGVARVRDGRIVEWWGSWDSTSLLTQLGALVPSEKAATRSS